MEESAVETPGERPVSMSDADRARALLREVVALVDAGDLEATPAERAHLVGAADTLERLG